MRRHGAGVALAHHGLQWGREERQGPAGTQEMAGGHCITLMERAAAFPLPSAKLLTLTHPPVSFRRLLCLGEGARKELQFHFAAGLFLARMQRAAGLKTSSPGPPPRRGQELRQDRKQQQTPGSISSSSAGPHGAEKGTQQSLHARPPGNWWLRQRRRKGHCLPLGNSFNSHPHNSRAVQMNQAVTARLQGTGTQ